MRAARKRHTPSSAARDAGRRRTRGVPLIFTFVFNAADAATCRYASQQSAAQASLPAAPHRGAPARQLHALVIAGAAMRRAETDASRERHMPLDFSATMPEQRLRMAPGCRVQQEAARTARVVCRRRGVDRTRRWRPVGFCSAARQQQQRSRTPPAALTASGERRHVATVVSPPDAPDAAAAFTMPLQSACIRCRCFNDAGFVYL